MRAWLPPAAVGVCFVLAAGCAQREVPEVARIRTEKRAESRERVVYVWSQAEKPRPERLDRAARYVEWNEQRHERLLDRDFDFAAWWWQRDVDRAPDRRERYRDALDRILGGKPDRIERNAIILFY